MKDVKLDELEPGMITAKDILTHSGHLLLPAGTQVTARHIRMLRARAVGSIAIGTGGHLPLPDRGHVKPAPARSIGMKTRVARRFQYNDMSHPFIQELARVYESRLVDRA